MAEQNGRIAQVVPDLPTFAVDDGFAYQVPAEMTALAVGSVVRVPLGSRRIRGYVTSLRAGPFAGLKPVISVSGDHPVFDDKLLQTLRWAALHYVAPLSVLLGRAAPPNLPRGRGKAPQSVIPDSDSPLPEMSAAAAAGSHARPTCLLTVRPYAPRIAALAGGPLRAGKNVAAVAPTYAEAVELHSQLAELYGDRVMLISSNVPAKETTRAWVRAHTHGGYLIVGTPEFVLWPLGSPASTTGPRPLHGSTMSALSSVLLSVPASYAPR